LLETSSEYTLEELMDTLTAFDFRSNKAAYSGYKYIYLIVYDDFDDDDDLLMLYTGSSTVLWIRCKAHQRHHSTIRGNPDADVDTHYKLVRKARRQRIYPLWRVPNTSDVSADDLLIAESLLTGVHHTFCVGVYAEAGLAKADPQDQTDFKTAARKAKIAVEYAKVVKRVQDRTGWKGVQHKRFKGVNLSFAITEKQYREKKPYYWVEFKDMDSYYCQGFKYTAKPSFLWHVEQQRLPMAKPSGSISVKISRHTRIGTCYLQ
jgi:hypothetical protein